MKSMKCALYPILQKLGRGREERESSSKETSE